MLATSPPVSLSSSLRTPLVDFSPLKTATAKASTLASVKFPVIPWNFINTS